MVGTSKILTVSYGTFSCTLEGFDEPFSTMKAIAEYFRDLAADDRYFGAEPPTPDAAMLHSIAEREIQRRVEAKINAGGIVLRATVADDKTAPETAPLADSAGTGPVVQEYAAAAPQDAPATQPLPDADSAAAKLMRIRAVVAERGAALTGDASVPADFADADLASGLTAYDDLSEDDFGFDLDLPEPPAVADRRPAAAPEETAAPGIGTDTPLQKIFAAETATVDAARDAQYDPEEDDRAPALTTRSGTPSPETSSEDGLSFVQRARARVIKIRKLTSAPQPVFPATPAVPTTSDMVAPPAPAENATTPQVGTGNDVPIPRSAPQSDAPILPDVAASDQVDGDDDRPDDDEDVTGSVTTIDEEEAAILADISATLGETGLDADDAKDLMRQLAKAARDNDDEDSDGGSDRRTILAASPQDDEAAVARLMEEAKSQLEGDENRRRFNAISHLKAAVAATVADRKMKSEAPAPSQVRTAREMDRYREDLSKVVRPHRADPDDAASTRKAASGDRATPLVLVSEQRIGATVPPVEEVAVIRTNRPSPGEQDDDEIDAMIAAIPSPESARNFAEYAERMGATGLSDLLEVAAAYTATVEGLPHFSRPQILLKVAHVANDVNYSREDGLRTFGMLLREGKIEKLSRGQFKITGASKYMTDAKRA